MYIPELGVALDAVLDLHNADQEDFSEVLGHVGMLDGALERREHLFRELADTIDRAAACLLVKPVGDIVVEVGPPAVIAACFDSHTAKFCTAARQSRSDRASERPQSRRTSCIHLTALGLDTKTGGCEGESCTSKAANGAI